MRFGLYRGVPCIMVQRIFLGWTGFATPFFICLAANRFAETPRHELEHFYQWWRYLIVGFVVLYLFDLARGYRVYRRRLPPRTAFSHAYHNVRFEKWARQAAGQPAWSEP